MKFIQSKANNETLLLAHIQIPSVTQFL